MSKFRDEAYYANLDKRTKEYKQWKEFVEKQQAEEPKGLGDVVAKVTEVTGIKKAVEAFYMARESLTLHAKAVTTTRRKRLSTS